MVRPKITKSMNALIDRLIKNPKILEKHEETAEEFLFNERSKWDQLEDTYIQYNPKTREVTTFILPSVINSDDEETDIDLETDDDEENGSDDDENIDEIDDTATSRPSISYIKTKRSISTAQPSTHSKKLKLGKNTSKYTTDISSESETEADNVLQQNNKVVLNYLFDKDNESVFKLLLNKLERGCCMTKPKDVVARPNLKRLLHDQT
ncbi:hypothetical protein FQR65_LT19725 [Abscondita terminalis]|nr:hypothetical protein FQR65_LT19725 [Abscondita terminalis]